MDIGISIGFKDAQLWFPTYLPNLVAWYDPSQLSGSGLISQLDDLSGNGNHAVQGTPANQPEIGHRSVNGRNVLTARDGAKTMNVTNTPNMLYSFGVVNLVSSAALNFLVLPTCVSINYEFFIRSQASSDISFDFSGSGTGSYSLNGSSFSSLAANHTTPNAPQSGANIILGGFDSTQQADRIVGRGASPSFDSDGHDLCELFFTSSAPTAEEKKLIENYYSSKWGITL